MFARVKKVKTAKTTHEYLQIVSNYRENNKVKQKVIATLGRLDKLQETGAIDGILTSLARFSTEYTIIKNVENGSVKTKWAKTWGPILRKGGG